jgi:hypothetical protein
MVSADGAGIVSQAGGLLLTRTLHLTGLDRALEAALERWRPGRAVHGPGKIVTDLAVALAVTAWRTWRCCAPSRTCSARLLRIRWSPGC